MNAQLKVKDGYLVGRGIQWTDYTHNPIRGCEHACRWTMPDGSVAVCYAEEVAGRVAGEHYRHGFAHHYWQPEQLGAPAKLRQPARIFVDSMSDAFGAWVPEEHTRALLQMCQGSPHHTFQSLTKAAPRLLKFRSDLPTNLWVGASSPPDQFLGQHLTRAQQGKMLGRTLEVLADLAQDDPSRVTWMSIEPLSWDISEILAAHPQGLRWAVIGAATNGPVVYQPEPAIVRRVVEVLDRQGVPVFFKGNLWGNAAAPAAEWREFFPGYVPSRFQDLIRAGRLDAHTPSRSRVRMVDVPAEGVLVRRAA